MTRYSDILVVGAGPSGLAAATEAANGGARVTVLDENPAPGGQIWRPSLREAARDQQDPAPGTPRTPQRRKDATSSQDSARARALAAFHRSGATLLSGRRVIDAPQPGILQTVTEDPGGQVENPPQTFSETFSEDLLGNSSQLFSELFSWDRLILATGARERFLPFPGWTLPGVFGAGGLQALVQGGFPVSGKRVLVAGTGPLLLAVAAHLQEAGAEIVALAEQASLRQLLPFAFSLASHPAKLLQGARYRATLAGVPYRTGCWPVAAEGSSSLTAVRLTDGRRTWTEPCELLACGFHLVPNTELASLLGCAFNGDFVAVDHHQKTSLPNIFCVGEPTGIAGLDAALVEGRIAGIAALADGRIAGPGAAGPTSQATALGPADLARRDHARQNHFRQKKERSFATLLTRAFALRPELRTLPSPDTIVCRCEDVRYGQLQGQPSITSWTDAKLQTRCGMGPCQGRICGPALQTLFGWRIPSVRPPLYPVPLAALCASIGPASKAVTAPQETPCTGLA